MADPPRPVESDRVDLDGLRLRYLLAGSDGEPVVLLHGGGMDSAGLPGVPARRGRPGRPPDEYVDRLPDLAVPTLLIHGEDDRFVPAEWSVRAGTLIPDAEVRVLPRCGHGPPRERPERVVELLRSFLSG